MNEAPDQKSYERRTLLASISGYAMDGFDLLLLGFLLRPISAALGLTSTQAGSLITWTLLGSVVGGVLFGSLSDRLGRVRVLKWTILLFAVFTGLCGLARGYWDLLAYRAIAGVGLGGEFGIGMAMVAEAWPASKRARASSYVALGWQMGVLAAALATPLLLPFIGWRGMFALGLLPAIISSFLRRYLEEPALFVSKTAARSDRASIALLVKDSATTKATVALFILCSVQNFGYYGIMTWLPSYLSNTFGYSLTKSSLWTAFTIVGMSCGIWLFGHLADRYGRRPALILYQVGAVVSVLVYSHLRSSTSLLVGGAIMGVFVNGMLGGYGALMSELYPTEARATAQNVLFNLGRAVGGFGPFVVGAVTAAYSFRMTTVLLSFLYVVDILATTLLLRETKNVALE